MVRVYAESVKKWALRVGVPATSIILLYILYSVSVKAMVITDFNWTRQCAGNGFLHASDPCWVEYDFYMNNDTFWYPVDYDPWGRNVPFNFSDELEDWKLYRSWGSSWREINLSKSCPYTWCGAPYNGASTKYSVAWRQGRNYTIRVYGTKKAITDDITVNFNPTVTWNGVTMDFYKISNTDSCFQDCSLKFAFKLDKNYLITDSSKFMGKIKKSTRALNLSSKGFRIGRNESYNVSVLDYINSSWEIIGYDNSSNPIYGWVNTTFYKTETRWHRVYSDFNPAGKTIQKNKWYFIELWGRKQIKLGENNIHIDVCIGGYCLPFTWWNTNYDNKRPINISVGSGTTETGYHVRINITNSSNMLIDFSDLRFANGTEDLELDYWIENYVPNAYAEVWIELDKALSTTNYTIYMYYNNGSTVSAATDGEETFLFFDDFEDNSINTSKWSVVTAGCYESDQRLSCAANSRIESKGISWLGQNVSYVGDVSMVKVSNANTNIGFYNDSGATERCVTSAYTTYYSFANNVFRLYNWNGASIASSDTNIVDSGYYNVRLAWTNVDTRIYINGTLNVTLSSYIPNTCRLPFSVYATTAGVINVSWVAVTKFHLPLPTYGIGAEESIPAEDTCPCPASGNWEGVCEDNCTISSECDMGGNDVYIRGYGQWVLNADIINHDLVRVTGTGSGCNVTCDGGCFKV